MMRPLATNCRDHEGSRVARIHQWDGKQWNYTSDWYEADMSIIRPLIRDTSTKYAAEKKITRRSCEAEMKDAAAPVKTAAPAKK
jgi:branched-chain amino acid transport system substrate-binding protein